MGRRILTALSLVPPRASGSRRKAGRTPIALLLAVLAISACGAPAPPQSPPMPPEGGFRSGECNLVSDAEVDAAAGGDRFSRVVANDVGCFWQENAMVGSVGVGMGVTTWWYRGSDMDAERTLESRAGRALTETTMAGNKGFEASDANACSVYVAKDNDVIAWSIQTLHPEALPDLCGIVRQLAELTQDRVN